MERSYTLPWHYIAGALAMVLPFVPDRFNYGTDEEDAPPPQYKRPSTSQEGREWTAEIFFDGRAVTFIVRGDDASATVQATVAPGLEDFAERVLEALDDFASRVKQAKRLDYRASPDGAIESYYRAKARNEKITLADVAARTGYTEAYLRKVKVEYDRAGKWGSKRKTLPDK